MNLAELFRHETGLIELSAGQTLFREGEQADLMYVLRSGSAAIMVHGKVVEIAEAGAMIGEMGMIDEGARSATVVAQSACTLVPIDRKRFDFLIHQTPNFALHVMRVIARRLRRTDATL